MTKYLRAHTRDSPDDDVVYFYCFFKKNPEKFRGVGQGTFNAFQSSIFLNKKNQTQGN